MAYFLALDVGGTKTTYLLADETRELARVTGGSIKRLRVDARTASRSLDRALAELESISGVPMSAVTRTCLGTAGISVPLVADWLREEFSKRVGGSLLLLGDVEIALDTAFHGGAGVLLIIGTGSNVAGRAANGQLTTAGGWGPVLSDQGSGHRIGYCALRDMFLAYDEEQATPLMDAVRNFWKLASIDHMIEYANGSPAPDFSQLSSVVLDCALKGDTVAMKVLQREGEELAHLALLVIRRLERFDGHAIPAPQIAFTGSVAEKVMPVREALLAAMRREYPDLVERAGVVDAVQGALWRARQPV
jgi:glucosamine kinase